MPEQKLNTTPVEKIQETPKKKPMYRKPWVRVTALVLAIVMVFSLWAGSAIRVKIQPGDEMDAATNYLVDNTDYVNQDEMERLQEKLLAYQKAVELEDYYRLAGTQIASEDYAGALESVIKCLELYPGGDDALYVDLLLKQACLLVLVSRNGDALTVLDKVLVMQPDHADAYLIKAQIYAEQEQMAPLGEVLAKYLELVPEAYEIRLVYAQALFEQQAFQAAIEQYELLLTQSPEGVGRAELLYLAGLTYLQLSDYEAAADKLIQAAQLNDTLDGIYYYIGICQMSLEEYEEAVQNFTLALDGGSMVQHCYYSRGVCLLMVGNDRLSDALADLAAASNYAEADADASVKVQADELIAQLQEAMVAAE